MTPPYPITPLTLEDLPQVMALQEIVIAALPDPRWYFTSTEAQFAQAIRTGIAYGARTPDGQLAGFCIFRESSVHPSSYAVTAGLPREDTLDFEDVMIHPSCRRCGLHSRMIALAREEAASRGLRTILCTVDPDNLPSLSSFTRAGFTPIAAHDMYDGRPRLLLRFTL